MAAEPTPALADAPTTTPSSSSCSSTSISTTSSDASLSSRRIALIMAMEAEARPIIDHFKLKQDNKFGDTRLPFQHFTGVIHADKQTQIELLVSINGKDRRFGVDNVCSEPAVLNTYISLTHFAPHLVISAGTAGGWASHGTLIGDVYLSADAFRFHDRRIPIPNFQEYGVGTYPVFAMLNNHKGLVAELQLKTGAVSTGNSLDIVSADQSQIDKNGGHVKEMEAAAVAWIAHQLNVPMIALKSITDLIDKTEQPTVEQFLKHLAVACGTLREKVVGVLEYLASHPEEWCDERTAEEKDA